MDQTKELVRALLTITALDERRSRGQMDAQAEQALQAAEAVVLAAPGRKLLEALRTWCRGGVKSHDPTGGYVRIVDERSDRDMAMRPGSR
jgi:hypothetical protein